MKRWTRMDFPPELPPQRIAGLRIGIDGMAACAIEVETDIGSFFFGGPITNGRLTMYATIEQCEPFVISVGQVYFPHHIFARSCILHHEAAEALSYTIAGFAPIRLAPTDVFAN